MRAVTLSLAAAVALAGCGQASKTGLSSPPAPPPANVNNTPTPQSPAPPAGGDIFANNVAAAEKSVATAPTDPVALAALAQARYQLAASGAGFDSASGTFTAKGKAELAKARTAWNHYLALKPKQPNVDLADEMVRAFEPAGLNLPTEAVATQEIVAARNPTSPNAFATLAVLGYLASQTRTGDRAAAKAVSLAPAGRRAALKAQLATAKTQAQTYVAAARRYAKP